MQICNKFRHWSREDIAKTRAIKPEVFGILDVDLHEIIWLELPFRTQTVKGISVKMIQLLVERLKNKTSSGELLEIKAKAQHLTQVPTAEEADEAYTYEWALNP